MKKILLVSAKTFGVLWFVGIGFPLAIVVVMETYTWGRVLIERLI